MSQAVIKIGSSQYLVVPGQQLLADKGTIDQVIYPATSKVTVEDLGIVKGEKIRVSKFKAKSRYRKVRGFRAKYHKIRILDIREK